MDQKNRKLLDLLSVNARESIASLARQLGLSRTAVHERIRKMETSGVIAGYTVKLDPEYRKNRIRAEVMIAVNPKFNQQVLRQLHSIDALKVLRTINGQFDLMAMIQAESTEEIDMVLDLIGEVEGIEKTMSSIILSTKFER